MNNNRKPNWPTLLGHFFYQNADRPFVWGEWDCCLFAADAIKEITGQDFASELRGKYDDAFGAARLIHPHRDLCGLVTELLPDNSEISIQQAQRGDLAVIENQGRQCAAIFWGRGVFAATETGLVQLPNTSIIKAWRI